MKLNMYIIYLTYKILLFMSLKTIHWFPEEAFKKEMDIAIPPHVLEAQKDIAKSVQWTQWKIEYLWNEELTKALKPEEQFLEEILTWEDEEVKEFWQWINQIPWSSIISR